MCACVCETKTLALRENWGKVGCFSPATLLLPLDRVESLRNQLFRHWFSSIFFFLSAKASPEPRQERAREREREGERKRERA